MTAADTAKRIATLQHMGVERGLELRQHKIEEILVEFVSHVTASHDYRSKWQESANAAVGDLEKQVASLAKERDELKKDNSNQHATIEKMSTEFAKLAAEDHMQERQHEGDKYVISDLEARVESLTQELKNLQGVCPECGEIATRKHSSGISRCGNGHSWRRGEENATNERVERLEKALRKIWDFITPELLAPYRGFAMADILMKIGEIARKALQEGNNG